MKHKERIQEELKEVDAQLLILKSGLMDWNLLCPENWVLHVNAISKKIKKINKLLDKERDTE